MTFAEVLQIITAVGVLYGLFASARLSRNKLPSDIRVSDATAALAMAEKDKVAAETTALQNKTIADLQRTIAEMMVLQTGHHTIVFGLRKELGEKNNEIVTLTARVVTAETGLADMSKLVNGFPEQIDQLKDRIRQQDTAADEASKSRLSDAQTRQNTGALALINAGGTPGGASTETEKKEG